MLVISNRYNPDVSEADRVAVILQDDRTRCRPFRFRQCRRRAGVLGLVLDFNAVEKYRHLGISSFLAVRAEAGCRERYIERLPCARCSRGIRVWRLDAVECTHGIFCTTVTLATNLNAVTDLTPNSAIDALRR